MKMFLRFLLILVVQLLLFEHLDLGSYLYPMPYLLFLLLFPCTYGTGALMLWAFTFGFLLDLLSTGIMGLHTSAFVALAAFRNGLIKAITVKGDLDLLSVPGFNQFGTVRFIFFVFICTGIHHTVYFFLEAFSFLLFWHTTARLAGSLLLNTFLILLFKRTFYEQKR
ncbi:MAG: rod shape-determining protein MreD [Bacteroidales bacterium]